MSNKSYKCWDEANDRWLLSKDEDTEFIFFNGKWYVRYAEEINIPGNEGVPERDVPVWRDVENPIVVEI